MLVLLTRPQPESEATAGLLAARGHRALIAPLAAIAPLAVTLPAEATDATLITSAQAPASLSAADRAVLTPLPLLAVGEASARAARAAGFKDVRTAPGGEAAALADLARLTLRPGAHLLYLAGRLRKSVLPEALSAAGFRVTIAESYDTRPLPWPAASVEAIRATPPAACLHFSKESVLRLLAEMRRTGLEGVLAPAAHLCLSADVASPLAEAGVTRLVVAAHPDAVSLLQALDSTLSQPGD